MLSALLSSIQNSLVSRGFLVGSLFPVLIFVVGNGAILYGECDDFSRWLTHVEGLPQQAFLISALLLAIIIAAYILSAASSVLQETLEGKHRPVSWFNGVLYKGQLSNVRHLRDRYWMCVLELGHIFDGLNGDPKAPGWIDLLENASNSSFVRIGPVKRDPYPVTRWQRITWNILRQNNSVDLRMLSKVMRIRESGGLIPVEYLDRAVKDMVRAFSSIYGGCSEEIKGSIDADHRMLVECIYFSRDRYQEERIRLYNLRNFQFPSGPDSSANESGVSLGPTRIGNIGRTIRSYSLKHYGFDLDVLWTRLQNASQTSTTFYTVLQDAKAQLDFFVALTWFALTTTIVWLILELSYFYNGKVFIGVGVVGPLTCFLAYRLACRSYSVFADLMRSCVDLFRFKVLGDLHLPLPPGLEEERVAWQDLANVMGYMNLRDQSGNPISVTYKH